MEDSFKTISGIAEGLFKEKGSKFISYAYPVKNEEEIKLIIASIRKEHFSARHCCYAWKLGIEQEIWRANDDGEPSGTAGKPILNQIQSFGLKNVLVVVVRYFGGTLLGVSGLINAYKSAAIDALNNSTVITSIVEDEITILFDYIAMNPIMQTIKEFQLTVVLLEHHLTNRLKISVRTGIKTQIIQKIKEIDGVIAIE